MTLLTPVYSFPYPENTDPPNGPAQFQALALAVENLLSPIAAGSRLMSVFTAGGSLAASVYPKATALLIYGCNGGAASGGCGATAAGQSAHSGPGAGGASAWRTLAIGSFTFPLTIAVGSAGIAGAAGNTNGNIGGVSSVTNGATTYWTPGNPTVNQRGLGGAASATIGDASVPGFEGFTTAGVGDIIVPGQGAPVPVRYTATQCTRQYGGHSSFGTGGYPGNGGVGFPGFGFGSGGGGSYLGPSAAAVAGAAGAPGLVVIVPVY